jgi:hypothetical protein
VRFDFDQTISAPIEVVEGAITDTAFYEALSASPILRVTEVLERTERPDGAALRVRFAFVGGVSGAVRRVVDPSKLTWVMELSISTQSHSTSFRVIPDHYANILSCSGGYALASQGATTRQQVHGDLSVHVPLLGRAAEKGIVNGFREHMADEARLLGAWPTPKG